MALTVAQKNELATRLVNAQQTGNYGSFNDLVNQLRVTQADLLNNFPAINQAGIDEQISRGAVVPKTAPAAVNYTSEQVAQAIRDSLNAGFTVQQARMGAMTNFGLSSDQFDRALNEVQQGRTTFTDDRVAQAIRDSLAQGFTLEQAREGALNNYGVGTDQFNRAARLVSSQPDTYRGSAPTFQFPGLLGGREDRPVGAQRFLNQRPGSLLFDVPKVQGGEFTFTPGAFDYEAIREQLGTSTQPTVDAETAANSNALAAYNAAQGTTTGATKPVTTPVTTPGTTAPKVTTPTAAKQYTDAQVAQALRESMAQGFTLDQSKYGAMTKYGVSQAQLDRAIGLMTPGGDREGDTKRLPQVIRPTQAAPVTGAKQASAMDAAYFQSLLQSPEYGGKIYGEGVQRLPGLPPNLTQAEVAKLFPQGTSEYIPQEVSVSVPDYFGYIVGEPGFDTNLERARAAQRAFSSAGTGQSPADQEYEMKNYLNTLAGGLPMTGGVSQGAKPLLPLLTAMDVAAGRMTSEQADALQFLVSNAENYNRLQQDIPMYEQQGYTAYLEKQKPYFEQLGKAFKDYGGKLSGLDVGSLSSRELFSLIPEAGRTAQTAAQGGLLAPVTQLAGPMNAPVEQTPIAPVAPVAQPAITPVTEPTQVQTNLLANPSQFSDAQVAQAIIDSLGQGFNMDQIRMGAFNNFGVTPEQFTSASEMLPSMGYTIGGGFR